MKELSVDSNKARQICRQMIKDNVAKYLCIVQENRNNTTLSLDLRRYIEAMQYTLKGHAIWCQTCHRYNPNAKYNNFQLSLMEKGVAETIKWCSTSRLETPISPKTEQPGPNLSDRLNL